MLVTAERENLEMKRSLENDSHHSLGVAAESAIRPARQAMHPATAVRRLMRYRSNRHSITVRMINMARRKATSQGRFG